MTANDSTTKQKTDEAPQLIGGSKPDPTSSPPLQFESPGGADTVTGLMRCVPREIGCLIIQKMRRLTPKGARKPWRTAKTIEFARCVIAEGAELEEVYGLLQNAAEMIEAGEQDPKFWHLWNLFEGVTCERWVADQGPWLTRKAEREGAERQAKAIEARQRQEAQGAAQTPSALRSLEIARLAKGVIDRMGRARNEAELDEDVG